MLGAPEAKGLANRRRKIGEKQYAASISGLEAYLADVQLMTKNCEVYNKNSLDASYSNDAKCMWAKAQALYNQTVAGLQSAGDL